MEEFVTFSGKEAEPLTTELIQKAIALLAEPQLIDHKISHNCSAEEFAEIFHATNGGDARTVFAYLGLPVYQVRWIPRGEIWLQDKDGKVIQKYSLPARKHTPTKAKKGT